jgi:hypothetical protein
MAIIIFGKSTCSLCKKVLLEKDEIKLWSPFLNAEHKFWKYSDSGMHMKCFQDWNHKEEFEALYNYLPLFDFEDPKVKEMIEKCGMPDWMKRLKEYREKCFNPPL